MGGVRGHLALAVPLPGRRRGRLRARRGAAVGPALHRLPCASDAAGKLDLTAEATARPRGETGQPAIVPGDVEASYLVERIKSRRNAAGRQRPPGRSRGPGDARSLDRRGRRLAEGSRVSAFDFTTDERAGRDWWSLKKPLRPQLADRAARGSGANADRRLRAGAGSKRPASSLRRKPTAPRSFAAQSFDLLGLPPTPAEIEAFVATRRAMLTSGWSIGCWLRPAMASAGPGIGWTWCALARSNGYETNTARPNAWPYRDWVIAAFNDDMPYPQFVLEQLAGDQVGRRRGHGLSGRRHARRRSAVPTSS